jgi:hypothetical protein
MASSGAASSKTLAQAPSKAPSQTSEQAQPKNTVKAPAPTSPKASAQPPVKAQTKTATAKVETQLVQQPYTSSPTKSSPPTKATSPSKAPAQKQPVLSATELSKKPPRKAPAKAPTRVPTKTSPSAQANPKTKALTKAPQKHTKTTSLSAPEFETVYEDTLVATQSDTDVGGLWSDTIRDVFGLHKKDVIELLSEEADRLTSANFILYGIDFNPQNLSNDDALADIRARSIQALALRGVTYTQTEIDNVRNGERERTVSEVFAPDPVRSGSAPFCLCYHFASGVMTPQQTEEFESSGVLSDKFLHSSPPTTERLYNVVKANRFADDIARKLKNKFTRGCVTDYDEFWRGICSEICNLEYGCRSYWIASGSEWAIGEYAAEVIKTAYACGLSVTPVISLEQLRALFERSHNYLNDLEFIHESPGNIRDTLEQFSYFNSAYRAIYEGAVTAYKPKPPPPYRFTFRAYTESDVVIVTLPSVGLIAGGAHVLTELIKSRSVAGLATILVSTSSVRELNELNAGFIPEFFSKSGASLIARKDATLPENISVCSYVYFSIYGDASERGSAVQTKTRRIADRQR